VWDSIFEVDGSLDGKWPEPIAKVCVNEESACHGGEGEVTTFRDSILIRGIRDGFLIRDAGRFAISFELSTDEFWGIVNAEN
jgi:hypothetical protein